jgi:hypothetical protein
MRPIANICLRRKWSSRRRTQVKLELLALKREIRLMLRIWFAKLSSEASYDGTFVNVDVCVLRR